MRGTWLAWLAFTISSTCMPIWSVVASAERWLAGERCIASPQHATPAELSPLAYAAHLLRPSLASQQQHTWAGLPDWAKYSQLGYFLHLLAAKKLALATAGAHAAFWRHGFGLLYTYRWWRFVQKHLATLPISVIAPARVNKTFLHVVK